MCHEPVCSDAGRFVLCEQFLPCFKKFSLTIAKLLVAVLSFIVSASAWAGDCAADFGTCLRVSSMDWTQSPCSNGLRLVISGTETEHKYDVFYADSHESPIPWKIAKKGITASGTNFTWTDCGTPSRPAPSEVLSRLYVAGLGDDTDGDGLGSAYELLVLHTNPDLSHTDNPDLSDGEEDFDSDGYSNLQEYNLGTDPFDPASFPTAVPAHLVARWKLDEGTGTFIADSSANGLNGWIVGILIPTWSVNTNTLYFSGSGSGSVLIPNSNCLSSVTSGLTVSAWVQMQNNSSNGTVVSKWLADGTDGSFCLSAGQGFARFEVFASQITCDVECSTNRQSVSVSGFVPNSFWHLITGTFSGAPGNSTANIYVDGICQTNQPCGDFSRVDHVVAPVMIGLRSGTNPRPFTGTINDVRIYDRALGSNEIAILYSTNVPPLRTYAEFALWSSNNASLYFKGGEVFNGHVHSDGQLYFDNSGGGPIFHSYVTSLASSFVGDITGIEFDMGLQLNSYQGSMADVDFNSPSANSLKNLAVSGGLLLDGASTITFNGGTLSIINVRMYGNLSPHVYTPPAEGIIYIKNSDTGTTSTQAGKAYLTGGFVTGRLTIVTEDDIHILGHIRYGTEPVTNPASSDALGLISRSDVWVDTVAPSNLVIQAAIMATGQAVGTDGSFSVINYNDAASPVQGDRGRLTVYGGIVQLIRGPVGQFNSTTGQTTHGYAKNYSYDPRFLYNPPPYYPVIHDQIIVSKASSPSEVINAAARQTLSPSMVSQSMVHVQMENLRRMVRDDKLPQAFGRLTLEQIDKMEKEGALIQ